MQMQTTNICGRMSAASVTQAHAAVEIPLPACPPADKKAATTTGALMLSRYWKYDCTVSCTFSAVSRRVDLISD